MADDSTQTDRPTITTTTDHFSQHDDQFPVQDEVLIDALFRSKNRMFILRLERSIIEFLQNPQVQTMELTPMNSYYRLLAHKIAEYYAIGHVSNNSGTAVNIYKTALTKNTIKPLADLTLPSKEIESNYNTNPSEFRPRTKLLMRTEKKLTLPNRIRSFSTGAPPGNDKKVLNIGILTEGKPDPALLTEQPGHIISQEKKGSSQFIPEVYVESVDEKPDLNNDSGEIIRSNSPVTDEAITISLIPRGMGSLEAREAAYQAARARIFSDFNENSSTDLDHDANLAEPALNNAPISEDVDPEYNRKIYPTNDLSAQWYPSLPLRTQFIYPVPTEVQRSFQADMINAVYNDAYAEAESITRRETQWTGGTNECLLSRQTEKMGLEPHVSWSHSTHQQTFQYPSQIQQLGEKNNSTNDGTSRPHNQWQLPYYGFEKDPTLK